MLKKLLLTTTLLIGAVTHADEIFTTIKPKSDITIVEAKKAESFGSCAKVKTGKSMAAVMDGDKIFVKTMPANDETAEDKVDDKKTKVYRCILSYWNTEKHKISKVK